MYYIFKKKDILGFFQRNIWRLCILNKAQLDCVHKVQALKYSHDI